MTTDAKGESAPVIIARAVRTRGLRGELVAEMLTDFPDRFDKTDELIMVRENLPVGTIKLESHWLQNGRVILKLAGVNTIEQGQEFVGCSFGVPETETIALNADEYYDWQLEACAVETVEGVSIGTVREVLHTGGGVPVLLIESATGGEHLIPLAKTICVEVDTEAKRIRVDAPEGLLDL